MDFPTQARPQTHASLADCFEAAYVSAAQAEIVVARNTQGHSVAAANLDRFEAAVVPTAQDRVDSAHGTEGKAASSVDPGCFVATHKYAAQAETTVAHGSEWQAAAPADPSPTTTSLWADTVAHCAEPTPVNKSMIGLPLTLRRSEQWCSAWYCTPHVTVPGQLHITDAQVHFIPDRRAHCTEEFGATDYEVRVQLTDLIECASVVMPIQDDAPRGSSDGEDVAFFLQLHVRTLDGQRYCDKEDIEHAWCVVFQLLGRSVLNDAAHMLLQSISRSKEQQVAGISSESRGVKEQTSSGTFVPFPSLDCATSFEAATQKKRLDRLQSLEEFLFDIDLPQGHGGTSSQKDAPTQLDKVVLCSMGIENVVLNRCLAESLLDFLPISVRVPGAVEWVLKYTPKAHGVSLATLFRTVADSTRTLLLVQDAEDHVFGGYAPEAWEPRGRFYGSGEAFVFSFGHVPPVGSGVVATPQKRCRLETYPWTLRNDYFMYCDHELLAMGGGDTNYAIAIFGGLLRGRSAPTPTFGNPILASAADFVIRDLEIWSFEEVA